MRMKIVIADGLPSSALESLRQPDWIIDAKSGRAPAELASDLKDADALIVRSATKVTRDLIDGAPKLRVIARAGTGVDNVDVPAATARGIVVMNAPGANSVSVAEHAIGLMLSLARPVPAADASMKAGKWEKSKLSGAGLDVFDPEPPKDWRLAALPQVVATPHIAASTREAQEQVGEETAAAVRDFLQDGIIRNAVNFPSVSMEEFKRLRPYLLLAKQLGSIVGQMGEARIQGVGVRYYGALAEEQRQLMASSVLEGGFWRI